MDSTALIRLIREERLKQKISQKEMAEYLGISPPSYSKIESGKASLTIDRLSMMAKKLDIHLFVPNHQNSGVIKNNESLSKIYTMLKENQKVIKKILENTKE